MSKEAEITDLCRPFVESMGLEWVGVEYRHHSRDALLRIYLDKEGGISMDDIVAATEELNPFLDAHDPIGGMYTLEVSSPGLDRPLFALRDFERFIGHRAKINLRVAMERRRRFEGVITAVEGENIHLTIEEGKEQRMQILPYSNIDKARLVPIFED